MDEILPRLYLGNLRDVSNKELLRQANITHILSIIDKDIQRYKGFEYK